MYGMPIEEMAVHKHLYGIALLDFFIYYLENVLFRVCLFKWISTQSKVFVIYIVCHICSEEVVY